MFIGKYNYNLDDKGRISIPNNYKEALGEKLVAVMGFEECIYLYSVKDWNELSSKIDSLSFTKQANRKFARLFLSNAFYVEVDAKGRINLDSSLINHANLKKECVFLGSGNRVEIWDLQTWQKYLNDNQDTLSMIAEEVDL